MSNTHADCTRQTKENTQHKAEKTKKQDTSKKRQRRTPPETAVRAPHAPSSVPPSRRSATVDPISIVNGQKMAERGRHARQRAKGSLARAGHTPNSDDRRDLCFWQRERTTKGDVAKGHVS